MWLKGDLLIGYNSDSVCFEINHVFSGSFFIACDQGDRVVGGRLETGRYSLRYGFLTKDSQPFTIEINHFSIDRAISISFCD